MTTDTRAGPQTDTLILQFKLQSSIQSYPLTCRDERGLLKAPDII